MRDINISFMSIVYKSAPYMIFTEHNFSQYDNDTSKIAKGFKENNLQCIGESG